MKFPRAPNKSTPTENQ